MPFEDRALQGTPEAPTIAGPLTFPRPYCKASYTLTNGMVCRP